MFGHNILDLSNLLGTQSSTRSQAIPNASEYPFSIIRVVEEALKPFRILLAATIGRLENAIKPSIDEEGYQFLWVRGMIHREQILYT